MTNDVQVDEKADIDRQGNGKATINSQADAEDRYYESDMGNNSS